MMKVKHNCSILFTHSFRDANTHQVSISWLFDEFGLFGLRCHQPLPQPICLLAAEQKEEVRHGPWAKRAMWESAKPMEWKVDNCLFANKSPASERKRGYAAVCWTRLSRLQSKAREREKERGKEITVCWLHFILTMMFDIQSVSHPCQDLFFLLQFVLLYCSPHSISPGGWRFQNNWNHQRGDDKVFNSGPSAD